MGTLAECLGRARNFLSKEDVAAIESGYDAAIKAGKPEKEAAIAAVQPVLAEARAAIGKASAGPAKSDFLAPTKPDVNEPETPAKSTSAGDPLVEAFRHRLASPDGGFDTIVQARKFAEEHGFKKGEDADNKTLEEAIELAVVLVARDIVRMPRSPEVTYQRLIDLYKRQPKLGTRTSKSMAEQAYSTPAPIAYIASRQAKVKDAKAVLEPTAGNGMLLIEAIPSKVQANELDDTRADNLRSQGFVRVTQVDAATKPLRHAGYPVDAVIMNPPFGAVMGEDGRSTKYKVDGWPTTRIDYAIAFNGLKHLADDGRAVLILGGPAKTTLGNEKVRKDFYNSQAQREFYFRLYDQYNVVDHFTVDGDLYSRQGAGWPIDLIVVSGRGKSSRALPAVNAPQVFDSFEALKEKLDVRTDETRGERQPAPQKADDAGGQPASSDGRDRATPDGGKPAVQPPPDNGSQPVPSRGGDGKLDAPRERAPDVGRGEESRNDRTVGQPARAERPRVEGENELQKGYQPASTRGTSLKTLVPANMATATKRALDAVGEDVDIFVSKKLGYSMDEGGPFFMRDGEKQRPFSAEQIDALALGIKEYERGGALIIGDQTGIGKGRVVAGMIRFALQQGQVPVFLTEKPDLYGDMFRDMNDIGLPEKLGRPVAIFATNAGSTIPLDDDAVDWKGEADEAVAQGLPKPPRRGTFLKTGTTESVNKVMDAAGADAVPGYDVVFTTYDQTNTIKKQEPPRRNFLRKMMPNAFLIMDEAHNAGGTKGGWEPAEGEVKNRADFLRELVEGAKGILYSSATYAKRPDVMDLYRRTDMAKAVEDISELGDLIQKGGVPMQQVVASMLAGQGQYVRRERSFEGIEYALRELPVDRDAYDSFTMALRAVQEFDLAFAEEKKEIMRDVLAAQGAAAGRDAGVGEAGARSTAFASVMHNLVNQMLASIKAEGTVEAAIRALENDEKPVIALASTMESFISDYADAAGLKTGDKINITFKDALRRYLERTRRITVKNPDKTVTHIMIPVEQMSPGMQRFYRDAQDQIEAANVEKLPISPIDYLRNALTKNGYKVKEITGRKLMIDYSGKEPKLATRDPAELGAAGKRVTVKAFNDGRLDVIIFNRSGSTGISMHSSSKFKDKRKRRMLLQQAEGNIDTHMQTLGRVNRTGQVVLPAYDQLAATIPAEARPAAVLLRKMASLNANTTASRKGALTDEKIVDFMNQYGDQVVAEVMAEHPEWHRAMNDPLGDFASEDLVNAAAKVTGKMTLLRLKEQEQFLDEVTKNYKALIAQLDAMGENALEAKSLDLQAITNSTKTLKPSSGQSLFENGVFAEWTSIKSEGRSLGGTNLVADLADALKEADVTEENRARRLGEIQRKQDRTYRGVLQELQRQSDKYISEGIAALKDEGARGRFSEKARDQRQRFNQTYMRMMPGMQVAFTSAGNEMEGVVTGLKRTGETKNPIALGSWEVTIAIPDGARQITVPMSQIYPPGVDLPEGAKGITLADRSVKPVEQLLSDFDTASKSGRTDRWIITGNLLAAYEQVGGTGQIINYTTEEGDTRQGILMPKAFDYAGFEKKRPVQFANGSQVVEFIDNAQDKAVMSRDGYIELTSGYGQYQIEIYGSRQVGGKYFLHPEVRRATDDKLTKAGSKVRWLTTDRAQFVRTVDATMKAGAKYQTTNEQELASKIVNPDKPPEPPKGGAPKPKPAQLTQIAKPTEAIFYSPVMRAVESLKLEKAGARQWMNTIRNAPGVKKEELDWVGLEDWLAAVDRPVTRKEVADFIRANQVQVSETVKGNALGKPYFQVTGAFPARFGTREEAQEYIDRYERILPADAMYEPLREQLRRFPFSIVEQADAAQDAPQYSDQTLPGGENYRELLFTLPSRGGKATGPAGWADTNNPHSAEGAVDFNAPHFAGTKNLLAHVRFNERTDADGKKVLFIEEIQSDWHQKGRKQGYHKNLSEEERVALDKEAMELAEKTLHMNPSNPEYRAASDRVAEIHAALGDTGVPDAPFKTTWPELAMKRMIRWAAENGFDRIAWTPGDVQADRYDLSKKISRIKFIKSGSGGFTPQDAIDSQDSGVLKAYDLDGRREIISRHASVNELPDLIGKEAAEKLMAQEPDYYTEAGIASVVRGLSGLDLKVGGEGMRGFYDKILVDTANKLGKKFGAKVLRTGIVPTTGMRWTIRNQHGVESVGGETEAEAQAAADTVNRRFGETYRPYDQSMPVPSIDITPALRDAAMQGLPLFQNRYTQIPLRPWLISQERADRMVAEVMELSERMLGRRIRTDVVDYVSDPVTGRKIEAQVTATYRSSERAVAIAAMLTLDPIESFRHEAIHALRDLGVISIPEWNAMAREGRKFLAENATWAAATREGYQNLALTSAQMDDLMLEEGIAEAFAQYRRGDYEPAGFMRVIFDKIMLWLERLREYFAGNGFQTAGDLFAGIERGDFADRAPVRDAADRGYGLFLKPEAEAQLTQRIMPPSGPNVGRSFQEPEDDPSAAWQRLNSSLFERVQDYAINRTLPLRRYIQDTMADWARVEAAIEEQLGAIPETMRVYRAETLFAGRSSERIDDLRTDDILPLVDDMAKRQVSQQDLDLFLYARHAPERNAYIASINPRFPDGGSGMTDAEAQQVIQDFQNSGMLPDLVAVADRIDRMLRQTRARLLRDDIITQDQYDQWDQQYQYYVPLRGFETDPDEDARLQSGKKYDTRARAAQEALGRRSRADSPVAYAIAQAQQAIILGEKARVGRSVLRLARQYPNRNLWEIDQKVTKAYRDPLTGMVEYRVDGSARTRADNVLAVRVGDKLFWVTLHHPGMAAGVKGMDAASMHALLRFFGSITRFMALMRTGLDPQFFIPNFIRDLGTAGIHMGAEQGTGILRSVIRDLPRAARGVWNAEAGRLNSQWAQYGREFAQAGGKVGIFGLENIETIKGKIETDMRMAQGGALVAPIKAARYAKDLVLGVNSAIENAIRLSMFVNMRRAGFTQDQAAYAAKEVTVNFNRRGHYSTGINAGYMFFNAGVQGAARVFTALVKSRTVRRVAIGLFVAGLLSDMMNAMLSGDDDDDGKNDYDQLPEYIRERNLVFMIPGTGDNIHLPLPWVYNVFHYAGVNVGRAMRGVVEPTEAAANVVGAFSQAANPLYSNTWFEVLAPSILDPGVQLYLNRDFADRSIMPDQRPYEPPKPESQRYWESVNPIAKEVTDALNRLTGGDEFVGGKIDVSPEAVEFAINTIFGGVGQTYNQVISTVAAVAKGDKIDVDKLPFVRKVYGRHSSQFGKNEFYRMRAAIELADAHVKGLRKLGEYERAATVEKKYTPQLNLLPALSEADKLLVELRKQRRQEQSSERKRELRDEEDRIRAQFRKLYYKATGE